MNELAINIEYLLLTHEEVIVPGLGTFRAMQTPARYVASEHLFLPPVRNVHFDPSVTNDPEGIFLLSLSTIYGYTAEEAVKNCEAMVSEFHKMLVTEGTVDFGSIGVFTLEDDATITMASCECGVTTPEYYGLDTLHFNLLNETIEPTDTYVTIDEKQETEEAQLVKEEESPIVVISQPAENTAIVERTIEDKESDHVTIKIRRNVIKYAFTIAAVIMLFFIISPTRIESSKSNHMQNAQMGSFLRPNMITSHDDQEYYYYEEADETTDTNYIAPLIDITQEVMNEGYDVDASIPVLNVEAKTESNTHDVATPEANAKLEAKTAKTEEAVASNKPNTPISTKPSDVIAPAKGNAAATNNTTASNSNTRTTISQNINAVNTAEVQKGSYAIVLASAISKNNANEFVNKLSKQGIKASVFEKGKMRRVIIDGFDKQADAYSHLNEIKKKSSDLTSAWVLKL